MHQCDVCSSFDIYLCMDLPDQRSHCGCVTQVLAVVVAVEACPAWVWALEDPWHLVAHTA